jgi:hypothetical protein
LIRRGLETERLDDLIVVDLKKEPFRRQVH